MSANIFIGVTKKVTKKKISSICSSSDVCIAYWTFFADLYVYLILEPILYNAFWEYMFSFHFIFRLAHMNGFKW